VPSACAPFDVIVTRFFASDCAWRLESTAAVRGRTLTLTLTAVPQGEICLPVARAITFEVSVDPRIVDGGPIEVGEWELEVVWTDGPSPEPLSFTVDDTDCAVGYRLGDANDDGNLDLADAVRTLGFLFTGADIDCVAACDVDGSEDVNLSDPIYLLNHLFLGGPTPEPAFDECVAWRPGGPLPCSRSQCTPEPVDVPEAWMARADGCMQCEPCGAPELREVVAELFDAGISVLDSQLGFVPVCLACTVCASGRYYLVLVPEDDAEELVARGWEPWIRDEPGLGPR